MLTKKNKSLLFLTMTLLLLSTLCKASIFLIDRKLDIKNVNYAPGSYGFKGDASGGHATILVMWDSGTDLLTVYSASLSTNAAYDESLTTYVAETQYNYRDAFDNIADGVTVTIGLSLTGNVTLTDLREISLPGIGVLQREDFIAPDSASDCPSPSSDFCKNFKKVRTISFPSDNNPYQYDFIIQAHRGLWGPVYNENTLGAMKAAKANGIFLLESDIMPYGINAWKESDSNDSSFAKPDGLVCFHDYDLKLLTDYSGQKKYIFEETRENLKNLHVFKPRSHDEVSDQKILFFDSLVKFVGDNDLFLCIDMKNLEAKVQENSCKELCAFQSEKNRDRSLMLNIKKGIEVINRLGGNYFKNIAFKTYLPYDTLRHQLVDIYKLDGRLFSKVLWAPMIAPAAKWKYDDPKKNGYDPRKILIWLDSWFAHNRSVLYYETNFMNHYDGNTSILLDNIWPMGGNHPSGPDSQNIMTYIYTMTGRRSGIFSEEPVGGKGVVNRWGNWKIKNPNEDRRGDHIALIHEPLMDHAVYTTDRPDVWQDFNKKWVIEPQDAHFMYTGESSTTIETNVTHYLLAKSFKYQPAQPNFGPPAGPFSTATPETQYHLIITFKLDKPAVNNPILSLISGRHLFTITDRKMSIGISPEGKWYMERADDKRNLNTLTGDGTNRQYIRYPIYDQLDTSGTFTIILTHNFTAIMQDIPDGKWKMSSIFHGFNDFDFSYWTTYNAFPFSLFQYTEGGGSQPVNDLIKNLNQAIKDKKITN